MLGTLPSKFTFIRTPYPTSMVGPTTLFSITKGCKNGRKIRRVPSNFVGQCISLLLDPD